ncbi:hypothetical protein HA397_28710, partial [Escherichia coli]|nr:hypothetical protein [Escherichia coli]
LTLSALQFGRVQSALVGERLIVLANRTASPFQAAARLGLPITDVRNASTLLETARATDERISAIYVFDETWQVVHSTGDTQGPSPLSEMIGAQAEQAPEWYKEIAHGHVAGITITAPSGKLAGGIAVIYPRGEGAAQVRAMTMKLSMAAFVVLTLGVLAAGILLRIGLRATISGFDDVGAEISGFESDMHHG